MRLLAAFILLIWFAQSADAASTSYSAGKSIGPNFANELAAAGLAGLPVTWTGAGGFLFDGSLSPAQIAAVKAVINAHDPTKADPRATLAQLLSAGCQIASSSAPALNGTYPIDPATQQQVASVALYIAVNGRFPAGQTSFAWSDVSGTSHLFASTSEFQAFATALADYVAVLNLTAKALLAGGSAPWPAQPVAIP
jgi:hypothetical protein